MVEQGGEQRIEATGLLGNNGGEGRDISGRPCHVWVGQLLAGGAQAGERRLHLVGDRGEERRLQLISLGQTVGGDRLLRQLAALQGQGCLAGEQIGIRRWRGVSGQGDASSRRPRARPAWLSATAITASTHAQSPWLATRR